ncbi:MAG: protein-methionine-sulfoxide reductase catalytic subunit MsrP, partial [Chloroflexota bacterium]|nr:protein-methionine-sulfoxide reductase catalytic subunit MsrP [Chloroflexota bacterium]
MTKSKLKSVPINPSEITPEHVYVSRRQFLKSMGILGAGAFIAACASPAQTNDPQATGMPTDISTDLPAIENADESGNPVNTFEEITNFNNYYEFTLDKTRVAGLSKDFQSSPWEVEVYGLVENPRTFGLEDLLKFTQEDRIYRMRCVEGWSMVIPWHGFPLSALLKEVSPLSSAKYVRFETLYDPDQMPGLSNRSFPWPYQEGLRMDEAMNELTILATGLYGKALLPQNGAPIRLVLPWKYGFKSIKSIVKIELVDSEP